MAGEFIIYGGKTYTSGVTYGDASQGEVRFDLSSDTLIQTFRYLSQDGSTKVYRAVLTGSFSFSNGIPSGVIGRASLFSATVISGTATEVAQSYNFSPAVSLPDWLSGSAIYLPQDASSVNYFYTNSTSYSVTRGQFTDVPVFSDRSLLSGLADINYFPDGWWQDPFNFLPGLGGSTLSNNSASTIVTTTTVGKDTLIGATGSKDIFSFSSAPAFGRDVADHITNFVAAGDYRDTLAVSKRAFDILATKASIKKVKSDKALAKAAASKYLFVYDKRDGGLYLNANGKIRGFGENGGLFAILDNAPNLTVSNLQLF